MTPSQVLELRDMEQRLIACEDELTILLNDEQASVDELRRAVLLTRIVRATCEAIRYVPVADTKLCGGANIIVFPSERRH